GNLPVTLVGWTLRAVGLGMLADVQPESALSWIIAGSTVQAIGAGMLYTPLTTLAFATLAPDIRTDATGLYSLLRQLGYASGVALMGAILQAKISMHLAILSRGPAAATAPPAQLAEAAALQGYADGFILLAISAPVIIPG